VPGNTPFYAFPYPLGTDLIADGDDVIHSLATAVENAMKGTAGAPRAWAAVLGGAGGSIGQAVWTAVAGVTCTGCPVGAVLLAAGSVSMNTATPAGQLQARLASAGATILPSPATAAPLANQPSASYWSNIGVLGIATTTAPNPTVNIEGWINSGGASIHAGTHIVVARIV
jgi:hypothetical protein